MQIRKLFFLSNMTEYNLTILISSLSVNAAVVGVMCFLFSSLPFRLSLCLRFLMLCPKRCRLPGSQPGILAEFRSTSVLRCLHRQKRTGSSAPSMTSSSANATATKVAFSSRFLVGRKRHIQILPMIQSCDCTSHPELSYHVLCSCILCG